ncbi:hypothetical protein RUND412_002371 [Rhizina undulata]
MAGYDPVASARALAQNKRAAWIYACSFGGLITIFIIAHFLRTIFHIRSRGGTLSKIAAIPIRAFRRVFLRKLPKFTSGGHFLLILVYFGMNAAITFYDVKFEGSSPYSLFAKRCGWMAIMNTALAFLLAMKNTPLAFLTGYSHERLNVLHRWVGRTIWFYACIHVYTWAVTLTQYHAVEEFSERPQIFGFIAFSAFNVILITSLQVVRRRFYEFFYVVHVSMFIIAVIFLGLHKPHKFAPVMIAVGSFWIVDRTIRTARGLYYSRHNAATLIPLPGLATKVIFDRKINCQPGSHAFISIPAIRKFQTHPFTISSISGNEFVIRAQKGFTLDLHKYALKHPGEAVNAYIDGPYGAVPDFKRMNKVVLIAGGSGGAFSFPVALEISRNAGRCAVTAVEFVWVIKDERQLSWYADEIRELQASPIVSLRIYVTSKRDTIATSQTPEESAATELMIRRSLYDAEVEPELSPSPASNESLNALEKELGLKAVKSGEKRSSTVLEAKIDEKVPFPVETLPGRPDLAAIVGSIVGAAEVGESVGVGSCGPTELMRVVRNAVAGNVQLLGVSVTLHCEQFGWG